MNKTKHIIHRVLKDSIAMELELEPGDELLRVNGQELEDVFDYHYLINEEYIELLVKKKNQEEWTLEIEKEFEEDLGIEFGSSLMDEYRSCTNHCIFCFIDQMPKGMRDTLYFKDDDSRLSFLQGNYVTLTNMSEHDIERITSYHLSPINISFQTTNPTLRCEMLRNRFAGEALAKVDKLYAAGIEMNGQIVLCKGINDGEELERSIRDLEKYLPHLRSVSIVPVGLSKYRENLYPLQPFVKADAVLVTNTIEKWQKYFYEKYGTHFIHGGDEWYLLAGKNMPEEKSYDDYLQLENGVGMLRLLEEEVRIELEKKKGNVVKVQASIATGAAAAPYLRKYVKWIQEKYPQVICPVYEISNTFFGENITVSGLITGTDLKTQLEGKELGAYLLLPCNMLRSGENVFLDDMTVEELETYLKTSIQIVDTTGLDLIDAVIHHTTKKEHKRRQIYEQTNCSDCGTTKCGQVHPV